MSAKDLQTRAEAWLKARMERLTPRQRLGLVTVLLLVYAAVALMILFGGMRSRETSIPRRWTPPAAIATTGNAPVTSKYR